MARFLMSPVQFDGVSVMMPTLRVSVCVDGFWSRPLHALIDTGATCTLMGISNCGYIGKSEDEARQGPKVELKGIGGKPAPAYRWNCDLKFLIRDGYSLDVTGSRVYVYDGDLPGGYQLLIGQHDALTNRALAHIKFATAPCYFDYR